MSLYAPTPLQMAKIHLGNRLCERNDGYWLDGQPVKLNGIMQATNKVLARRGVPQIVKNPDWKVEV